MHGNLFKIEFVKSPNPKRLENRLTMKIDNTTIENVTKQTRIIYYIEEETVYILHCFAKHKEYERLYKSFK